MSRRNSKGQFTRSWRADVERMSNEPAKPRDVGAENFSPRHEATPMATAVEQSKARLAKLEADKRARDRRRLKKYGH